MYSSITRSKTKVYGIYLLALMSLLAFRSVCLGAEKRTKVIDFEDEVVEGMNRRPLDSLSQISERNRKKHKSHLYRKRAGFRNETAESLRQVRFE